MSQPADEADSDTLSLSFLDLISCGLGASILLSIIYSLVGETPAIRLSAPRFLDVTFVAGDRNAVVNLFVAAPDPDGSPGSAGFYLDLSELDVKSGRMSEAFCATHPDAERLTLLGFSRSGDALIESQNDKQFLNVMIDDPRPGRWQVEALYRDKRDWTVAKHSVEIERWVVMRHLPPADPVSAKIEFGDRTSFGSVDVEAR